MSGININWNMLGQTKQLLNDKLNETEMNGWEIKELVLVEKGGGEITSACEIVRKPDGTITIVC